MLARKLRRTCLVAVVALAAGLVLAPPGPADASPKLGPVSGLAANASGASEAYDVTASWNVTPAATSYRVSLESSRTVLAKGTVPQPTGATTASWTGHVAMPSGTKVTVRVAAVAGRRPGRTASYTLVLPDRTAPVGSYRVDVTDKTAVLTELSVSDDVTASAAVGRSVDWGDGTSPVPFSAGQQPAHTYPGVGLWHPTVTLTDTAVPANTASYRVGTVVIGDDQAPTGSFSAAPGTAWATLTTVRLTQVDLSDGDFSAPADIARTVAWGDGTEVPWPAGTTTLTHRYAAKGDFVPVVHLIDEAGNAADVGSSTVVVTADATAPRVTISRPKRARSVSSWTTVRGTARDRAGTGVRAVKVRVVEKRGTVWYAYRAPSRTWARGGATKAAALHRAQPALAARSGYRWTSSVRGLRAGTLVVTVRAVDRVGNASRALAVRQSLRSRT
jgi:5'-nucleotidase